MKSNITLKLVLTALFSAVALIAFTLENLLPPLVLPGARIGVSNIFILLTAIAVGGVYGYGVLVVKTVLGSLFVGNVSAILYSLPAGFISLTIELMLIKYSNKVSIVAISVVGAVLNVCLQNVTFCLITNTMEYLAYIPYLALIGIVSGVTVGFAVYLSVKRLPIILVQKENFSHKEDKEN